MNICGRSWFPYIYCWNSHCPLLTSSVSVSHSSMLSIRRLKRLNQFYRTLQTGARWKCTKLAKNQHHHLLLETKRSFVLAHLSWNMYFHSTLMLMQYLHFSDHMPWPALWVWALYDRPEDKNVKTLYFDLWPDLNLTRDVDLQSMKAARLGENFWTSP